MQRRIDIIGENLLTKLVRILSISKHSLQIDESTINGNQSILMGYVRYVYSGSPQEEMLFAINMDQDCKAKTIFNSVKSFSCF